MGKSLMQISTILSVALASLLLLNPVARGEEASEEQVQSSNFYICDQPYALCTSAPCVPDPDDPEHQAICTCSVQDGESFGETSCPDRAQKTVSLVYAGLPTNFPDREREPQTIDSRLDFLSSTFSCLELAEKKLLICPAGEPWTDCLDAPCTVNPSDPSQAICRCPILREQVFMTLGGDCNPETCSRSYWSAATIPMMESNPFLCARLWRDYVCEDN